MTQELSDTQRDDLRRYAESIRGSEASYGATILKLMEERDSLEKKLDELESLGTRPQLYVVNEKDVLVDLANTASELADQRLHSMKELSTAIAVLRKEKDSAYNERDMLVCAFAKLAVVLGWEACIGLHEGNPPEQWDTEWTNVVYVATPHGQVSWHVHDSEVEWFSFLHRRETPGWDGHTSVEKYARLGSIDVDALKNGMRSFLAQAQMDSAEEAQATLSRKLEHLTNVATAFVKWQNQLAPGDFASIEFDMLERALGLREIVPDAVIQERLHQEIDRPSMDSSCLSDAVVED